MLYLSASGYFSKYGLSDCCNYVIGTYDTFLIYLNFMGDVWIFSAYLKFMLLKYNEKKIEWYIYTNV